MRRGRPCRGRSWQKQKRSRKIAGCLLAARPGEPQKVTAGERPQRRTEFGPRHAVSKDLAQASFQNDATRCATCRARTRNFFGNAVGMQVDAFDNLSETEPLLAEIRSNPAEVGQVRTNVLCGNGPNSAKFGTSSPELGQIRCGRGLCGLRLGANLIGFGQIGRHSTNRTGGNSDDVSPIWSEIGSNIAQKPHLK